MAGDSIAGEPAVFRATNYSLFHTTAALVLCFGAVHLNLLLVSLAVFVFPLRLAVLVFGVLLFFMLCPINEDSNFGKKISRYICKYAPGYFPITLHVEDLKAFDPNKAYVLGLEPHSVLPVGVLALSHDTGFMPFPKIKVLASSLVFYVPFLRHVWTWMGLIPASRSSFYEYLGAGYNCVLVPGGFQEMVHMSYDYEVAFVQSRKGFVRIAMEMGRPLVPVVCFGQNVYKWWRPESKTFFRICRALRLIPMVYWGRFGLFMPYRSPIHVVVGKPIDLEKNAAPTDEEVNEIHGKFVKALEELFENYKARVGHPHLQLKIV